MKSREKKIKAWAVYGQWGHTGAWTMKDRAEKKQED